MYKNVFKDTNKLSLLEFYTCYEAKLVKNEWDNGLTFVNWL